MGNEGEYHDDGVAEIRDLFGGGFDDLTGTIVTLLVIVALVKVAIAATPRRFRPLTRIVGVLVTGISAIAILT